MNLLLNAADVEKWVGRLARALEHRSWLHRPLVWATHLAVFGAAVVLAFLLRFEFGIPANQRAYLAWALAIMIPAKAVAFRVLALDRGWWRFVSISDLTRIGTGAVAGSAVGLAFLQIFAPPGFPRSIYVLDFILCFLGISGARVAARIFCETATRGQRTQPSRRVLIYGAGEAGVMLLRELRSNPKLHYSVCGFVDDNPGKKGSHILGVRVLGGGDDLPALVAERGIEEVLIAIPSAAGWQMTRILEHCHRAGVPCKTIPGLGELIETGGLARQIRDVAVEDLLGRHPVKLDETAIAERLRGRVVLVTGAAGSIGSELCRQIARFQPAAIVAVEMAETPLFDLERRMRQSFPAVPFHGEIANIRSPGRLREIFARYRPQAVYHAAAYKHVPVMEQQVFEAVENNIFGTYNVAIAGQESGVEDFVLISTDKAVRPTSVMGVTKRVAELVILSFQNCGGRYVAVRFGNVLGSQGSVVPLFKEQIAAGGPVTVTHPEMRRYFMTIPEAAQLVLQAAAMGKGGEIFLLDMGEPVRIADLARNLILLSGLRPDEDIKIVYTEPRPGEKLFEELKTLEEGTAPTFHEKIRVYTSNGLPRARMEDALEQLRRITELRDLGRLVLLLKDLVPDYNPSRYLLERVLEPTRAAAAGV